MRSRHPGEDDALAHYLGKIQLELTRQDLKTGKGIWSRSPWQIGLEAAETGDAQDAARWCEYLRATKGRNVVTTGGQLAEHYGEPTEDQLYALLDDTDPGDDQADDTDPAENEAVDIASMDSDVWTDLVNHRGDLQTTAVAEAITALEDHGPDAMADLATDRTGHAVEVIASSETGLPHLQYADPIYRRRPTVTGGEQEPHVDIDALGPAARAWYGARSSTTHSKGGEQWND